MLCILLYVPYTAYSTSSTYICREWPCASSPYFDFPIYNVLLYLFFFLIFYSIRCFSPRSQTRRTVLPSPRSATTSSHTTVTGRRVEYGTRTGIFNPCRCFWTAVEQSHIHGYSILPYLTNCRSLDSIGRLEDTVVRLRATQTFPKSYYCCLYLCNG